MTSADPQIAGLRHCGSIQRCGRLILIDYLRPEQEIVDLFRIEPGDGKVDFQFLEVEKFLPEEFFIPVGPAGDCPVVRRK
jgi:hypothetical protein